MRKSAACREREREKKCATGYRTSGCDITIRSGKIYWQEKKKEKKHKITLSNERLNAL